MKEDIERYSVIRTVAAVERCDVAILVIDAEEGITEQDAKILGSRCPVFAEMKTSSA